MATISLPTRDHRFEPYRTGEPIILPTKGAAPKFNRVAFAAAHVVADPLADVDPWLEPAIDWNQTIAFRDYLWDLGLGVAEAMDTAQRGMGLDWPARGTDPARRLKPQRRGRACASPAASAPIISRRRRRHGRRRNPRLRAADRGHRGDGRPADPHGKPRSRQSRQRP